MGPCQLQVGAHNSTHRGQLPKLTVKQLPIKVRGLIIASFITSTGPSCKSQQEKGWGGGKVRECMDMCGKHWLVLEEDAQQQQVLVGH